MVWLFFIGKRSLSTIKIISFKKSITMKILIFLTILGFFLITTAKAQGNSTKANFLKATVTTSTGVINYEATQVVVSKGNSTGKKYFALVAASKQGRIEIKLDKALELGAYQLNSGNKKNFIFYMPARGLPLTTSKCADAVGILTVTEISNTKVKGTFLFIGKPLMGKCDTGEKVVVSNSVFKV